MVARERDSRKSRLLHVRVLGGLLVAYIEGNTSVEATPSALAPPVWPTDNSPTTHPLPAAPLPAAPLRLLRGEAVIWLGGGGGHCCSCQ